MFLALRHQTFLSASHMEVTQADLASFSSPLHAIPAVQRPGSWERALMTHILTIFLKHERLVVFFEKERAVPSQQVNPGEMEGGRPVAPASPQPELVLFYGPEVILPTLWGRATETQFHLS